MSQKSTFIFLVLLWSYNIVYAESTSRIYNSSGSSVRGQVARIMMSGLGGAAFGVSTLSFYGEPQKHLGNVAIGAAIGLLFGSVYVTSESFKEDYLYGDQSNVFRNINQSNNLTENKYDIRSLGSPVLFTWEKSF